MPEENNENKKHSHEKKDLSLAEYRLVPVEEFEEEKEDKDTIDLFALAETVWENRKTVYKTVGVFVIIGLLIAFLSPVEYKTEATLMPELSNQNSSSGAAGLLQKYGGLLGINSSNLMSSNPSEISVLLYPDIVQSTPFMIKLMNQKIHSVKYDTTVTVFTYFNKIYSPGVLSIIEKYTLGLPETIKNMILGKAKYSKIYKNNNGNIISLNKDQEKVLKYLSKKILANVNKQSGIITISAEMPEARMSAIIAKRTINLLKGYVTSYRTQKTKQVYNFISGQYDNAKKRFQLAQDTLAKYQDKNINLATAQAQTKLKRLQDEYNLRFNLYNNLAQRLEQARIQVQQNTPVFKILEPATIPINKKSPKRTFILILFIVLGVIIGSSIIIIRDIFYKNEKNCI